MTQTIAIIGDGQMGLVMADALAHRGLSVRLWGPFPEDIGELARSRRSPRRLPGFVVPDSVQVTPDHETALAEAAFVLNAIPTQFIRRVWERIGGAVAETASVLCVSKGIENETLLTPTQVIADALASFHGRPALPSCALSGPTVAAELARHLPATLIAASEVAALAEAAQDFLNVPWLRMYRHDDALGVELAGATKNVIALAAGMVDGLDAGDNAKSALLARGLAEIARLGAAMGARVETFFGIAGVGDLATTCFSPSGRNRTCGERLGRGESLEAILESTVSVVEGVATTQSVMQLAARYGVEMPITTAVHAILFKGMQPEEAIARLMQRRQKAEHIG